MKTLTEGVRRVPMRLALLVFSVLAITTSAAFAQIATTKPWDRQRHDFCVAGNGARRGLR